MAGFRSILSVLAALAAGPAAGKECRLALALGFDVSRSVDALDYAIQRDGILAALADQGVRQAMLGRPGAGAVALAIYEWSGRRTQNMILPWATIATEADIDAAAAVFAAHVRDPRGQSTALGHALLFGIALLEDAPDCAGRTLDVSGDGRNNEGMSPAEAYRRRDPGDLTVNALAIGGHESDIADYFRREVIRGTGAFVETAASHLDFPPAIRRKLIRELSEQMVGQAPAAAPLPGG
jgi:hypothetical protein